MSYIPLHDLTAAAEAAARLAAITGWQENGADRRFKSLSLSPPPSTSWMQWMLAARSLWASIIQEVGSRMQMLKCRIPPRASRRQTLLSPSRCLMGGETRMPELFAIISTRDLDEIFLLAPPRRVNPAFLTRNLFHLLYI